MTTLNTITTIELANICTLNCSYCIQGQLKKSDNRVLGIMSESVFQYTLSILRQLVTRGTQNEVNLNGNGESLMDKDIVKRVRAVKDIIGDERSVQFCTNGTELTYPLAMRLKDAGLNRLDISVHHVPSAAKAVSILRRVQLPGVIAMGAITSPHNWAGQLTSQPAPSYSLKCDPLIEGRGYVLTEGNISPCCYDFDNKGVFGTVMDEDILSREYGPYVLCDSCHQVIPEEAKPC